MKIMNQDIGSTSHKLWNEHHTFESSHDVGFIKNCIKHRQIMKIAVKNGCSILRAWELWHFPGNVS